MLLGCCHLEFDRKDYSVPPKALIIEALLKEVHGGSKNEQKEPDYSLPDNLKKFYAAMNKK